jgi:hypothetical protein
MREYQTTKTQINRIKLDLVKKLDLEEQTLIKKLNDEIELEQS